jgi:hypothetical protein
VAINSIIVGAHVKAYVNGRFWANVRRFAFRITSAQTEEYGLDSMVPFEIIPKRFSVSGMMQVYRQHGDGGLEAQGLTAGSADLPREKYVTLTLVNRFNDEILFRTDFAKFPDQNWDVPSRGIVTGSATFMAIDCRTSMKVQRS